MNRIVFVIMTLSIGFGGVRLLHGADLDEARNHFLAKCLGCHAFACNKDGPMLGGLLGRKAGSVKGYDGYSEELVNYGAIWTEETLNAFLKDPSTIIKFGNMVRLGRIEDDQLRLQMIEYLKTEDPSVNLCG